MQRELMIENLKGFDWLIGSLKMQSEVLALLGQIEDIFIFEEKNGPGWTIRFSDLSFAQQAIEGVDIVFGLGTSRVEASLSKLAPRFTQDNLDGQVALEFPPEVEDVASIKAISLVTYAREKEGIVKISLVYVLEKK